ncbi:MAG: tail fiber domain-containing protein [Chitinispirillaceae bacterium]|jgi:hypothetical protein
MNRIFNFKLGCSRAIIAGLCSVVFAATISAQVTSVQLPKLDSSASFQILNSGGVILFRQNCDGGFYAGETGSKGVIPINGAGRRLMWYPAKAAFRAGYVDGTQWDSASIGTYSTAMGYGTVASNDVSKAMGFCDTASGLFSTAMGDLTSASGLSSTAMGTFTTASGDYSTAMGYNTKATGNYSTAMGNHVSTNGMTGSFIIGDLSPYNTNSTLSYQMTMRFAGGYWLYTDALSINGVSLTGGGASWSSISDSTKKTNFQKADGNYFLKSLAQLKLGSWNYKAQDAKNYRHYGPMAQEIFHYFGHDGKGTIGCDTLLASADMDGIMMICLQALEKRTTALNSALEELKTEKEKVASIEKQNIERDKTIATLTEKIEKLSQLVYSSSTKNREQLTINTSKEELR